MNIIKKINDKMIAARMSQNFTNLFLKYVGLVEAGEKGIVNWEEVYELEHEDTITLQKIHATCATDCTDYSKLVIIKLNGGLGTSMGLSIPKSLMEVKTGYSFLKVITSQIEVLRKKHGVEIPFLLMDSFSTVDPSREALEQMGFKQKQRLSFTQHKVPRLLKSDLSPFISDVEKKEWCPPGHGDIFYSLNESGVLDDLLNSGYEYAFISNVDNLGAIVDSYILEYLKNENLDFAIEITPKTQADRKGGTLFRKITNDKISIELLEVAQVPKEKMSEFLDINVFKHFNTNNIWLNLHSLKEQITKGELSLSLIVNPKNIDGVEILQLETAMGSAVGSFKKSIGIIVPRDRFAPVKRCEDFLARRSDAYVLDEDFSLIMAPERKSVGLGEIVIDLDENYYKHFNDFEKLFKVYPSLVVCKSLIVRGKVEFDALVTIKGEVTIANATSKTVKISQLGINLLENETVTF